MLVTISSVLKCWDCYYCYFYVVTNVWTITHRQRVWLGFTGIQLNKLNSQLLFPPHQHFPITFKSFLLSV